MVFKLSRRHFLGSAAAASATAVLPLPANALSGPITADNKRVLKGEDTANATLTRAAVAKVNWKAEPFSMTEVRLLPSFWKDTMELNRSFLYKEGKMSQFAEKAGKGQVDFESVFTMQKMLTGAHLPGQKDVVEPDFAKGEEYLDKPNPKSGQPGTPKFSPRTQSEPTEMRIRTIDSPYHTLRVDMNGKLVAR